MASISERTLKNGTSNFQVMIRVKGQKPIIRTFDKETDAQRFIDLVEPKLMAETKKIEKRFQIERKKNPPFADFMRENLASAINLFMASDRVLDRHKKIAPTLLANIGDVEIGGIKVGWIKAYINKLRKKKTRRGTIFTFDTIATHMGLMSLAIKARAEDHELPAPALPFSTTLFPKNWEVKRERRLMPFEEALLMERFRKLKARSKYHWRLLLRLALETGARQQEMVLAEWSEFDIERRVWIIPAAHCKTNTTRAVPLSKAASRIMRLLRLLADSNSPRVFHSLGSPGSVSGSFNRYKKSVGITGLRFHDLRHEAISRMVLYKRKLSVFEIMKIVGHSSIEMLNRYANLRGDEMVERMD